MTFLLLLLSVFCISSPLSSALSPETLIQTPAGFVQIQHLRSGDTVVGIDLHTQKKVITKILEVRRYLVASRTKITTDQVVFTVSDDQLMRVERAPPERSQIVESDPENGFVAAQDLCVGDRLETNDGNYQTITKIERIEPAQTQTKKPNLFRAPAHSATKCAIFYGLHLDEPHHFYATEHSILMHNFAVAAPLAGELASMLCALGIGAAGSYFSPSNSGFNTPAFPTPATAPASSLNNFTQFRFDQLPPPTGELSAFSIRSSGNFNDHSFLFSGAQSTRLSMVPAGNFIHQYPDLTWTFNGLMGFDGNLLFQAIAKEASTDVEHDAGIFRGYRHDPELQHIIHAHDAVLTRKLEHYFDDLSDAQFELLASQTGCYDDKTAEVQTALAAFDLMYAGSCFASTVVYVCKQENISLSAIMHTINHGTKASSVYRLSPNYKVYESTENKLKVLTYEKPLSTILILGVSDLDGFVQVPKDGSLAEKYSCWQYEKMTKFQRREAKRQALISHKNSPEACARIELQFAEDPLDLKDLLEVFDQNLTPLLRTITQWELQNNLSSYPTTKENVDSLECSLAGWKFHQQALYGILTAAVDLRFILRTVNLAATFLQQNTALEPGITTTAMIADNAFIMFDHANKKIMRIFKDVEQVRTILATRPDIKNFDFTLSEILLQKIIPKDVLTSRSDLALPEDAPKQCGTGNTKEPQFPQPPPIIETLPEIPEGMCGGSGLLPNPETGTCGFRLPKEPNPEEYACGWSKRFKLPSFDGGDEVETEEDEFREESNTLEDEKESPIDSDTQSIEKPIDESTPEIKIIDEPGAEKSTEAALRPTDLERIDGDTDKQEHIIEGSKGHDHRLELVAPDKTWEQVRPIIEEVMKTGEQGKDQTDDGVRCKFKYIDNHPVVVVYKEGVSINHIGTIFIPSTEKALNKYVPKDKQR